MASNPSTLSLDPSNPDNQALAADWQDGQEYEITVRVKQTAPFKFEVLSATEAETADESGAGDESETPAPKPKEKTGNPAVDSMME